MATFSKKIIQLDMFAASKPKRVFEVPVYHDEPEPVECKQPSDDDLFVASYVEASDAAYLAFCHAIRYNFDQASVNQLHATYLELYNMAQTVIRDKWGLRIPV